MGKLLLFEGEQLVLRFRPHPFSYLPMYATALAWLAPGAGASLLAHYARGSGSVATAAAFFAFTLVAVAVIVVAQSLRGTWRFPLFAACLGAAAGGLTLYVPTQAPWLVFLPLALGALVALLRLAYWEVERILRLHFLTAERLVIRGGFGSRTERTIALRKVEEVRGERGVLGRLFNYGDVVLVFSRRMRGDKEPRPVEDAQRLRGIGSLEETKHQIEALVEESRMPTRDRRRRVEERRLKDSMRALATWSQRERPGRAGP